MRECCSTAPTISELPLGISSVQPGGSVMLLTNDAGLRHLDGHEQG
jgi:hypothetical protein